MATKQAVWGVDVGQCALKAIKMQPAGEKVEVLAYDVIEHEKILSHPESDAPALIRAALEKFASRNDTKNDLVAVAVSGQQTLSRFTKLPPVEQKKIPDIVKFEAGQQIPFDMDEVVWDYQTFSEPDSPDVEVGIFAIRKELIRGHIEYFTKAGIEPVLVQATPLALYNAVRFDKEAASGATILLDVGAQATDLIVLEGSSIWARPVPIGGNAFTEALVKAFKLSHAKAENLKRTAASTKYARQVFQAMRPVFADLIAEVQRSIGYYTSTHREAQIARIYGMGNAFKLPGLQKFMQQNLQIEVERYASFSRIAPTGPAATPDFAEAASSLTVAYGLALQGLGLASVTSTLLPPEIAKQLVWRKKMPLFWASAASLALSAGVIWGANAKAQSTLTSSVGTSDGRAVATIEDAETVLRGGATGTPFEVAGTVNKAISKLSSEYSAADTAANAPQDLMSLFQSLGSSIPLVPRIYEMVHQALAQEALGPDAKDGQEYLDKIELARRERDDLLRSGVPPTDARVKKLDEVVQRKNRREIWIQVFNMEYTPDMSMPASLHRPADQQVLSEKPGWLVSFRARTTKPDAAGWVSDVVLPRIEREGRKPDRGFYVHAAVMSEISTVKVADVSAGHSALSMVPTSPSGTPGSPRGGGPRGGFGGGGVPTGPSAPAPSGPAKTYEVPPEADPLTLEQYVGNDTEFVVHVLVVKENTPADLLAKEAAATNKAVTDANSAAAPAGPRP